MTLQCVPATIELIEININVNSDVLREIVQVCV